MTETWERELRKLRSVTAPPGTHDRIAEGPSGDPFGDGRGPRQRIVAAVVAFAVFAAAGSFAYQAFSAEEGRAIGGDDPAATPAVARTDALVVTLSFREDEHVGVMPVAVLTHGNARLQACTSGAALQLVDGEPTGFSADCNTPGPIDVPRGTQLVFDGEGEFDVEVQDGPPDDAEPGLYDLLLDVTWRPSDTIVYANANFIASVRIVDASPATDNTIVLSVSVDDRVGFRPHAALSYGGTRRELSCLSYTVTREGDGGTAGTALCGPGAALTVPVGAEVEVVSDREVEIDIRPADPTAVPGDIDLTIDVTWPANDVWRSAEASFQARLVVVERVDPSSAPSGALFAGSGTVLQEAGADPELCLGGVRESLPPQCSGVPLRAWDWDLVDGEQTSGGTTWGEAKVTGRFDGKTFVVSSAGPYEPLPDEGYDFTVPCDEPVGGWVASDPSRMSDDDRIAATRNAEAQPDHTASWISYLTPPDGQPEDPGPYVLVLGFTGDLERHRAEAAELWGGPLCVFEQQRTYRELRSIQRSLEDVAAEVGAEMTYSSGDVASNQVEMGVVVSSPELEQALVERFGEGAVRVVPALRPVG